MAKEERQQRRCPYPKDGHFTEWIHDALFVDLRQVLGAEDFQFQHKGTSVQRAFAFVTPSQQASMGSDFWT